MLFHPGPSTKDNRNHCKFRTLIIFQLNPCNKKLFIDLSTMSTDTVAVLDRFRPSAPRSLAPVKYLRMASSTSFCVQLFVVGLLPAASVK